MPVLYQHQTLGHHYILASVEGNVVTFHVSSDGVAKLRSAGVSVGNTFSRRLFFSLYHDGELSTTASGTLGIADPDKPQVEFDFTEDLASDCEFPVCDCCSSVFSISLVVVKTGLECFGEVTCADCFAKYSVESDSQTLLPIPKEHLVESRLYLQKLTRRTPNVIRLERILLAIS